MEALSIEGSASTEMEARLTTEECECISGETTSAYSYSNKNNLHYKCARCTKFYAEILLYLVVWRGFFSSDDYKKELSQGLHVSHSLAIALTLKDKKTSVKLVHRRLIMLLTFQTTRIHLQ